MKILSFTSILLISALFIASPIVQGQLDNNNYVDYVLQSMRNFLSSNGEVREADFLDITQAFNVDPVLRRIPINGTLRVYNVTVEGLSTVERTGPVVTDPEDGLMTFPVKVRRVVIGTTQVTTVRSIVLPVHSYLKVENFEGTMDMINRTDFGLGPAFSRLGVRQLGDITFQVTNWGFLNLLFTAVGVFAARNQSEGLGQLVGFSIPGVMNSVLEKIPALQPAPERLVAYSRWH